MITIADMSTRELLRAMHLASINCLDEDTNVFVGVRQMSANTEYRLYAEVQAVRAELDTRPHIPSKKEARVLRRIQSLTGMTEKQVRAIPKYQEELMDACYPNRRVMSRAQANLVAHHYGRVFNRLFKVV